MRRITGLLLILSGCQPLASSPDYDEFEVSWRLVEHLPADPAGDAAVSLVPMLVLEPEVQLPLILTRILNEDAGIGQPATMEVRVIGVQRRVRLHLKPSRPGVRVLGADRIDVESDRPFLVKFTSDSPGRASLTPEVTTP